MRKLLLGLGIAATASTALAADYSDDIHKNDYSWRQFNLMYAFNELPDPKGNDHDYLEMEFGGRSGIVDLYGYIDVFNLLSSDSSDKYGSDKMFLKLAPRFSLDGMTGKDLSFGPVQELYISTLFNINGGHDTDVGTDKESDAVNNAFFGLGADVNVPWLGKVGMNLYGLYDMTGRRQDWNGYQFSANWFKPLTTFENGSFLAYQGYVDYQFGMKSEYTSSSTGLANFNGLYWHSKRYAVGYGLKYFHDVYGIQNGQFGLKTTGFTQYVDVTYKF
ncbi:outer membrane protein OmpK [Marinomonas arenicola]|uniref:nucleoside-specific channel-forming Tsx family protein n=1 Tax=Marinomonas TaxID=28253 RepID=UPI0010555496|nr:outer membrane protein OmpK [Marinomonas sp. KMM3893]